MKKVNSKDIDYLLCYFNQEIEKKNNEKIISSSIFFCLVEDIYIQIPNSFMRAPEEYIQEKYFFQNHPQIVLKDRHGESNLLFQTMNSNCMDIVDALNLAQEAIRDSDSTVIVYDVERINDLNYAVAWFDCKYFAGRENVYSLTFIIDFEGKRIFGSFTCLFENYYIWKPIVLRMVRSVERMEEVNERVLD